TASTNHTGEKWIVVGGGLTGSALAYELAVQGRQVVLVEPQDPLQGATRYSYGGIPHWSATNPTTQYWCDRSLARYDQLEAELEVDFQRRSVTLLLTIAATADPDAALAQHQQFATAPQLLTPAEAAALEPALNPTVLSGALALPHGHLCPLSLVQAYRQGLVRHGGSVVQARYTGLRRRGPDPADPAATVTGIETSAGPIEADRVVISAGGVSRSLLRQAGLAVPLYYTQAEVVEVQHQPGALRGVVMPADNRRFALEAEASQADRDAQWDQPGQELIPASLDPGAVQFQNGRLVLGQTSRTWSDLQPPIEASQSEREIRAEIAKLFPEFADLAGTWHQCLVAFSRDGFPLVGEVVSGSGLYIFTGFSSPFIYVPGLAEAFATAVKTGVWRDGPLQVCSPDRFFAAPV
ncbi:MAG: NAD(P)/FAD-dependent oxidoreductase, partial [Prochlorothrix sp.]